MIKQSVPHFFTSLNLLCGCFSIYFAYIFQFETAFLFLLAGVFFDIWDGLFASLLGVESELGVQLDSMADMVTSGLAPGIILAQLFVLAGNHPLEVVLGWPINSVVEFIPWVFIGFILPLGSAFRLARFNLNGSKKNHFIGLPTPAMAMFFGSIPLIIQHPNLLFLKPIVISNPGLILMAVLFVILMNTNLILFSFKSFSTGSVDLILRILTIAITSVFILFFGLGGISFAILFYLVLNLLKISILKIGNDSNIN